MKKLLVNALFGTASELDTEALNTELGQVLIEGEKILGGYRVLRDLIAFSDCRLIITDKQGVTGKKTEYHSIPYRSISHFSVETAGHFDMDSELKVWVSSAEKPIVKEFSKGTNMLEIQRTLAHFILRR